MLISNISSEEVSVSPLHIQQHFIYHAYVIYNILYMFHVYILKVSVTFCYSSVDRSILTDYGKLSCRPPTSSFGQTCLEKRHHFKQHYLFGTRYQQHDLFYCFVWFFFCQTYFGEDILTLSSVVYGSISVLS